MKPNSGLKAGIAIATAAVGLPLLGAWAAGRNLAPLLRFPPLSEAPAGYPPFSWWAAAPVLATLAAVAASWRRPLGRTGGGAAPPAPRPLPGGGGGAGGGAAPRGLPGGGAGGGGAATAGRRGGAPPTAARRPMPGWGWAALGWTLLWWILAWTRRPWFQAAQAYTFFPLWIGFIVSVNALTWRRTGTCLLRRAPGTWLRLFAASAVFWWLFEWLNRFVDNWQYLGVQDFGPARYAIHATVCFSTEVPAAPAGRDGRAGGPGGRARGGAGPAWPWLARRSFGWLLVLGGLLALACTGARPWQFYPALWLAPLALALGEGILSRRPGIWGELAAGDWRRAGSWAAAALVCGFFWELWNFGSQVRWTYAVPYVDRWHLFAMPLLGYAGYLPFGLECLMVCDGVFGAGCLERA